MLLKGTQELCWQCFLAALPFLLSFCRGIPDVYKLSDNSQGQQVGPCVIPQSESSYCPIHLALRGRRWFQNITTIDNKPLLYFINRYKRERVKSIKFLFNVCSAEFCLKQNLALQILKRNFNVIQHTSIKHIRMREEKTFDLHFSS